MPSEMASKRDNNTEMGFVTEAVVDVQSYEERRVKVILRVMIAGGARPMGGYLPWMRPAG